MRAWWPAASAPPAGRRRPRSASAHRAHRRPSGRPPRAAPCSLEAGKAPARRRPGSLWRQWPPRSLAPPPAPGGWGRPLRVGGPDPLGASGRRCRAPPPSSALPALRWLPEKPSTPPIPWGLGMAPARRRPAPLVVGALRAARTPAVAGGAAASRPPTHRQRPGKASAPPAHRRPLGKAPSRCPLR